MPEEQQQNKSTRTYRTWKKSLKKLVNNDKVVLDDKKVKPYYDQGLMPDVCFKELFNK